MGDVKCVILKGLVLLNDGKGLVSPLEAVVDIDRGNSGLATGIARNYVPIDSARASLAHNATQYHNEVGGEPVTWVIPSPKYPKTKLELFERVYARANNCQIRPVIVEQKPMHLLRLGKHLVESEDPEQNIWEVDISGNWRQISLKHLMYLGRFYKCDGFYTRRCPKPGVVRRSIHTTLSRRVVNR